MLSRFSFGVYVGCVGLARGTHRRGFRVPIHGRLSHFEGGPIRRFGNTVTQDARASHRNHVSFSFRLPCRRGSRIDPSCLEFPRRGHGTRTNPWFRRRIRTRVFGSNLSCVAALFFVPSTTISPHGFVSRWCCDRSSLSMFFSPFSSCFVRVVFVPYFSILTASGATARVTVLRSFRLVRPCRLPTPTHVRVLVVAAAIASVATRTSNQLQHRISTPSLSLSLNLSPTQSLSLHLSATHSTDLSLNLSAAVTHDVSHLSNLWWDRSILLSQPLNLSGTVSPCSTRAHRPPSFPLSLHSPCLSKVQLHGESPSLALSPSLARFPPSCSCTLLLRSCTHVVAHTRRRRDGVRRKRT